MRRILPRLRFGGTRLVNDAGVPLDALVTGRAFARSKHTRRFDRHVARTRSLPAGFRKGLTSR